MASDEKEQFALSGDLFKAVELNSQPVKGGESPHLQESVIPEVARTTLSGNIASRGLAELKIMQPLQRALIAMPPSDGKSHGEAYNTMREKVYSEAKSFLDSLKESPEQKSEPWQEALVSQHFSTLVADGWRKEGEQVLTRSFEVDSTWQQTSAIRSFVGSIWEFADGRMALGLGAAAQVMRVLDKYKEDNLFVSDLDTVRQWAGKTLHANALGVLGGVEASHGQMEPADSLIALQSVIKHLGDALCDYWDAQSAQIGAAIDNRSYASVAGMFAGNVALDRISDSVKETGQNLEMALEYSLNLELGGEARHDSVKSNKDANGAPEMDTMVP